MNKNSSFWFEVGKSSYNPDLGSLSKPEVEELVSQLKLQQKKLEEQNKRLSDVKKELQSALESYQSLYDDAPLGYLTTDFWAKVKMCNHTLANLFSVRKHDILHGNIGNWFTDKDAFYLHCRRVAKTNARQRVELEYINSKGVCKYFALESKPTKDASGVEEIKTVFIDISERVALEKKLIANNESLILANRKAEESERLKSAFLANMSHEIRTPISGIVGLTELLDLHGDDKEKRAQYLQLLRKSGSRLLNTVNDILEISIIEAGKSILHPTKTDINQLVSELVSTFQIDYKQKGLRLKVTNLLPEKCYMSVDQHKLNSIFSNLLKNALKFTERGYVELKVQKVDKQLRGSVIDTGVGINPDQQVNLFQRFGSVGSKKDKTKDKEGSGLGLAITKSYCELHEGEVSYRSNKDGFGSTFTFYISEILPKVISEPEEAKIKLTASEIKGDLSKLNFLLVEDDETSQFCVDDLLATQVKSLQIASDGAQGVEMLKKSAKIDVILMDLKMPVMNGYEATEEIRKFNKDVVIIGHSAHVLEEFKQRALRNGFNDFLTKPLDLQELKAVVAKYQF